MKKREVVEILKKFNKNSTDFDLFLETGSHNGSTISEMKSEFKKIVSIEITEKFSRLCKEKFKNDSNVEIIKGDSLLVLPELLNKHNNKNLIFFLDAHCSAGNTGKNHLDVPLIEELKIINENYNNDGLIIIDDADMFDQDYTVLTWVGINEENIVDAIGKRIVNKKYLPDERSKTKKRLVITIKSK